MTATIEPANTAPQTALRACVFTLGGEVFAVNVSTVREVVVFESYTAVPRAASHVVGVANLRGDVVSIVDARPLLGLPNEERSRALQALVIGPSTFQVALVIDGVRGLESFEELTPIGEAARRRYAGFALGFLKDGDQYITLLDAPKIVTALKPRGGSAMPSGEE